MILLYKVFVLCRVDYDVTPQLRFVAVFRARSDMDSWITIHGIELAKSRYVWFELPYYMNGDSEWL